MEFSRLEISFNLSFSVVYDHFIILLLNLSLNIQFIQFIFI